MASSSPSQDPKGVNASVSALRDLTLTPPPNPSFPEKQGTRHHQTLADRRAAHRPDSITIPPPSPSPSELSTIKPEEQYLISTNSNPPRRNNKPNKDPRILLHTKTFRWVKMEDGVWVKVKRRRFVVVRK